MRKKFFIAALCLFFVCFFLSFFEFKTTAQSALTADPTLVWQTVETPHFRIHYHEGLAGLAQEAAVESENAFSLLINEFGYTPAQKTDIVLIDSADQSAGVTTWYGTSVIDLSVASLAEREDPRFKSWLQLNLFKNYAQVLEAEDVRGLPAALRQAFGYAIFPNWKPLLLLRGRALYQTYKLLGNSSAHNSLDAMILRAMVLENQFIPFDQASSDYDRPAWPPTSVLSKSYGFFLVRFLNETFGPETTKTLRQRLAENWLAALSVESELRRLTQFSLIELYQHFQDWARAIFSEQINKVQSAGTTTSQPLTQLGYYSLHPRWSPDGKELLYEHRDALRSAGIRLVSTKAKQDRPLVANAAKPSWSPDGKAILYIKTELEKYAHGETTLWAGDLYLLDLNTRRETRLTRGERVYQAQFFPDGERILFSQYRWGDRGPMLAILELKTKRVIALKEFGLNDYFIQSFALSPNGKEIALSIWRRGGFQDIYHMSSNGGALTAITLDRESDIDASWSADGQYIFFSSDRTDIYDLYAYQLADNTFYRVSNVLTGAFQPTLSADNKTIAFVGYSTQGYEVQTMDYQPELWERVEILKETFPTWDGFPLTDYTVHKYDARLSLSPKVWLPWIDKTSLGFWTFGQDALWKHRYVFSLGLDWRVLLPSYRFSYVNTQSLPMLSFEIEKKVREPGKALHNSTQKAVISLPFVRAAHNQVNLVLSYRRLEEETITHRVGAQAEWSHQSGFDLWQSEWRLSLRAETLTSTGDIYWHNQVIGGLEATIRLPWELPHWISIKAKAGSGELAESFLLGNEEFGLRGFASEKTVGRQIIIGSLTYQWPLWAINHGLGFLPFFIEDIQAMLFIDVGAIGHDLLQAPRELSFGAELDISFVLAYVFPVSVHLGALQTNRAGAWQWYARVGEVRF
jgi:Tol biopolymer transport system component